MKETPAEQAMALVRRLEESGALGSGGRLPALLRYLVQEELAGRGDRLKAYSIATEILGRGPDFDPAQDSIVRVEIGRLRKALDMFFATQGRDEQVKIEIPRGASRPRISFGEPPQTPPRRLRSYALAAAALALVAVALVFALRPAPRAFAETTPRLILLPVRTQGADPELRALALGLRAQLAEELSLQKWLSVLLLDQVEGEGAKLFAAAPVLIKDSAGYVLSAQLTSEPGHDVRWSARYRDARLHEPLAELAAGLAGQLARDLGYPHGPIGRAVGAQSRATDAEVEDQFLCMMNAYRFWNDGEPKQGADARACLTRLTAQFADFAEGRAALALLVLHRDEDRPAALAQAASLLRGAPEDDRLSIRARMRLAACQGEMETVKTLAHALEAAAPNDPDSLAVAAAAAGLAALDWPFALATEARALKLARQPKPQASQAGAVKATLEGDYEAALRALSRAPQQGDPLGQAMLYLLAKKGDAPARAQGAEAALAKAGVSGPEGIAKLLGRACWRTEIREAFLRLR